MPYMLKRSTGVKFHAKEFLKREAINVFTEIWVSPFTREICPHSRVKSSPFYILLLTGASRYVDIMIILAYSQQTNVLRTQILHHSTQYRHRKCLLICLSDASPPFPVSAAPFM